MNLMDDIGFVQKSTYSPTNKRSNDDESNINQIPVRKKDDLIKNEPTAQHQQINAMNKNGLDDDDYERDDLSNLKKSFINSNNDLINSSNNKNSKDKFDVYSMPSTRLLSDQERKFCNTIKLRPSQYVNLKTLILKVIAFLF